MPLSLQFPAAPEPDSGDLSWPSNGRREIRFRRKIERQRFLSHTPAPSASWPDWRSLSARSLPTLAGLGRFAECTPQKSLCVSDEHDEA